MVMVKPPVSDRRLTPRITGKIKVQSEAAQLYFVRVHAFVRAFFIDSLKNPIKIGTHHRFRKGMYP